MCELKLYDAHTIEVLYVIVAHTNQISANGYLCMKSKVE